MDGSVDKRFWVKPVAVEKVMLPWQGDSGGRLVSPFSAPFSSAGHSIRLLSSVHLLLLEGVLQAAWCFDKPFHPQTNGQTETYNQKIKKALHYITLQNPEWLVLAFPLGWVWPQLSTCGIHLPSSMPVCLCIWTSTFPGSREGGFGCFGPHLVCRVDLTWRKVLVFLLWAIIGYQRSANHHQTQALHYQVGQNSQHHKLAPRFMGPFLISKIISPVCLQLPRFIPPSMFPGSNLSRLAICSTCVPFLSVSKPCLTFTSLPDCLCFLHLQALSRSSLDYCLFLVCLMVFTIATQQIKELIFVDFILLPHPSFAIEPLCLAIRNIKCSKSIQQRPKLLDINWNLDLVFPTMLYLTEALLYTHMILYSYMDWSTPCDKLTDRCNTLYSCGMMVIALRGLWQNFCQLHSCHCSLIDANS